MWFTLIASITPPRKTRQGPWVKTYEYQWMLMRIVRANHGWYHFGNNDSWWMLMGIIL
jgi:hypothetical protein